MIRTRHGRAEILICQDQGSLAHAAAQEVVRAAAEAVSARGRFVLAVSGGTTPAPVYDLLASHYAEAIAWDRVVLFWGDERCVPPDDPRSNYRMVRTRLLDRVPVLPSQIYRIRGEDDPMVAAAAYECALHQVLAASPGMTPQASFDLALLGLGNDGHTASLFPGYGAVREQERWVLAEEIAALGMWRVTLTPVALNRARALLFIVEGAAKAETVQRVLEGPFDPEKLPAQAIQLPSAPVRWVLDRCAAARLAVPGSPGS